MPESLQPFQTIREILHHVLDVHLRRIRRYAAAAEATSGYRRGAVIAHLRERERELAAALARYEESSDEALATWVQSVPASALEAAAREGPVPADLDAILAEHRAHSDALIQLYEQMAAAQVGPPAQAVLGDLAEMERTSQKRLRHAMLDF